MTEILRFPIEKTRPALPALEEVVDHPARTNSTPPKQSGQPAVLLVFPDGTAHLRSTKRGYRALQLALDEKPDLNLKMKWDAGRPITAEVRNALDSAEDIDDLVQSLEDWLVVHAYRADEAQTQSGYEWEFHRAVTSPRPAPGFPYLWTTDFGHHGGLWLFGTPPDLEQASALAQPNDLIRPVEVRARREWSLEALRLPSRRGHGLLDLLERSGFWLRRDVVWCDCH